MLETIVKGAKRSATLLNLRICAVILLFATIAAPFGMDVIEGVGWHFLFWGLIVCISSPLGHILMTVSETYWGEDRPLAIDVTMVTMMTIIFTPVLYFLINTLLVAHGGTHESLLKTVGYVFPVTVLICIARRILPGMDQPSYFRHADALAQPLIHRRLPETFDGDILHLTVRDHFVDVIATNSTHTLRLRFADAVAEMEPIDGFCTHRSHWVNRKAISDVERDNGRIFLRLVNGTQVPVSRKFRPHLEDAGLIEPQQMTI